MKNGKTPVNWLRSFEVAARHLSLSAAASELNVTPAAVSQQVRLLELRLGEKLFVRHARGLRLTLAGEALVPVGRAFRRSWEAAARDPSVARVCTTMVAGEAGGLCPEASRNSDSPGDYCLGRGAAGLKRGCGYPAHRGPDPWNAIASTDARCRVPRLQSRTCKGPSPSTTPLGPPA